ncbi:MAG TPA: bifunctional oligoribonuclease/PAP phosphatase NrnA [Clostridiales bacterium]|jgi:phosphoesterase RecJ-like protein|nr:bifunctional oligoribonuclease/PAP phosphatase NrnA [Clostridiales bacterium]
MDNISEILQGVKNIVIAGHIRPDGDCVGSCTALYQYLRAYGDEFGVESVDVYLEPFGKEFHCLTGAKDIKHTYDSDKVYDLFISLDCGSLDRLGKAIKYYETAHKTLNIDHHISNPGFATVNHIVPSASSTCEVLFDLLEEEKITKEIAESLYVGIIHDTGVFKHSNTSQKTMEIAGKLISKGIDFSKLIDESFYAKTYLQNQILGRCLMESILMLQGKVIVSSVSRKLMDLYQVNHSDLDGIIDQLRIVKGVEVAVFIYETKPQEFKVSLRSNGEVNVSKIALYFGGGGHIRAAGCSLMGSYHDVVNNLMVQVEHQLKELDSL